MHFWLTGLCDALTECWFEDEVSYDNAKLAHALILSGHATGQLAVVETGLQALRWLTELQVSEKGHFRPIGSNGFYRRGGVRAHFDSEVASKRTHHFLKIAIAQRIP